MSVLINASTSTGLVQSADTSGEIELQSNGTTALKVNTNEGIQILNCLGVGNATPSTSGAGITFPGTQSASSDANTLDDYEEGTFTPTLLNATTTTYTTQAGVYTRIGRVVYFRLIIKINSIGNGSTRIISGLPFSLVSPSNNEACVSVANLESLATNVVSVYGGIYLSGGVPLINLTSMTAAASSVGTSALFQNGTQVELGGFYFTT